jgi:hypothetical protein
MILFKTKSPAIFPNADKIKDEAVVDFGQDLAKVITELVRNILDDLKNLERVERVDTLPTAALENIGKFYILNGTGAGADLLYICMDTGSGGYSFKQVTIA